MQLSLAWDAAIVGADDWDAELGWFRRAVADVGEKEVAYKLDIKASNLSDALNEAQRKDVKGRWISVVRRMASPVLLDDYVQLIAKQHGYEAPKRKKPMTDAEENRATRRILEKVAPGVLALIDKELGR